MLRLVTRRLLASIPVLLGVSFAMFVLVDLTPGDPAAILAGENASQERIAQVRESLRLDDPLHERYLRWLGDAARGDLGTSLQSTTTVVDLVSRNVPVTASLMLVTTVLATSIGGLAGLLAATRPDSILDRAVIVGSSFAVAVPPFLTGSLLAVVFAIDRNWFPAIGYRPMSAGLDVWLQHLLLPSIALAAVPAAELALQLRDSMIATLRSDYVVTARAKGLTNRAVIGKHALRNALIPVLTVLGYRTAQMLGGTVTVEVVFALPGIGSLAVASVFARDIPVLLGLVVGTTVVVMLVNLAIDILYGYLNPRLRA